MGHPQASRSGSIWHQIGAALTQISNIISQALNHSRGRKCRGRALCHRPVFASVNANATFAPNGTWPTQVPISPLGSGGTVSGAAMIVRRLMQIRAASPVRCEDAGAAWPKTPPWGNDR